MKLNMDLRNRKSKVHDSNKQCLIRDYNKSSEKCEELSENYDKTIKNIKKNEVILFISYLFNLFHEN